MAGGQPTSTMLDVAARRPPLPIARPVLDERQLLAGDAANRTDHQKPAPVGSDGEAPRVLAHAKK